MGKLKESIPPKCTRYKFARPSLHKISEQSISEAEETFFTPYILSSKHLRCFQRSTLNFKTKLTMTQEFNTTEALIVSELGGRFELKKVELKEMRQDEIIVKMLATGICHTDLATAHVSRLILSQDTCEDSSYRFYHSHMRLLHLPNHLRVAHKSLF